MEQTSILIVEDEAIIALDLKIGLERRGMRVTDIVLRGELVEESISKERPDFIVLDIYLAGVMSGIDVARLINEKYRIPFVFTTGNSDSLTCEAALSERPAGYFLKPVNQDDVINSIIAHLPQNK